MAVSSQVRAVVELFSQILEENHLSQIRAETLRQAKFNKASATQPLWKLLFNVVCFCKSSSSTIKHRPTELPVMKEEEIIFVKSELQKWGYLNQGFAGLPHDFSFGSRELLLALGWVIQTQMLFDKIISARSCPLQQELIKFVHQEHQTNTDRLPGSGSVGRNISLKEKIQLQLLLCGKLRLSLRRLYMTHQELIDLKSTVCKSTDGVSLQADRNHLSPFEVYLLRYPDMLKKLMGELEGDNVQLKNLLDWREKENVFWEWMESVLSLHVQEKSCTPSTSPATVEGLYLPVPAGLGGQITSCRAKLRDFILQHEADIEKMEKIIFRKKVSHVEVEALKNHVDNEISQLKERLQDCGRGWNWSLESDETEIGVESNAHVDFPVQTIHQQHLLKPKYRVESAQAIRDVKHAHLLESAKVEISHLEKMVHQLESELKELEMENLQKLQAVIEADTGMICVQPRYCKQLVNSR